MLKAILSPDQDYPRERIWYTVTDTDDQTTAPYARTADGHILDADGAPLSDCDAETIAVRNAIEDVMWENSREGQLQ